MYIKSLQIILVQLLLLVGLYQVSVAQLCEGNLGENIFTEGDFGSGIPNIPPNDPGIAPGYLYTTNPPPPDGSYCLTNNIAVWNQNWGWANIGDNSNDPNGYMMVVNASFDTGLFYEQVITGLCENTIYEFSADVRNLHFGANIILPNVSFQINNFIAYESGNVPENNEWNTYGFTFSTGPGQTFVKLSLANNAPGGIGNDLAIDNITFRACGPEALILPLEVANICEDGNSIFLDATINGDQYEDPQVQWQESFDGGVTWVDLPGENDLSYEFSNLAAGTYYYRYKLASAPENLMNSKCRILSNVKIVEVIPKFTAIADSLCQGLSFTVGNSTYENSGIYIDTLLNRLGCDSIVTSALTFITDPQIEANFLIQEPKCSNTSDGSILLESITNGFSPYNILFDGDPIDESRLIENLSSGVYEFLITDRYGCSVIETIELEGPVPYTINLGENQSVELGETINLYAGVSETTIAFNWFPEDIFPCSPNCTEQTWAPAESTWVYLETLSEDNCIAIDSVYIDVRVVRKLYIPSTFTPNGDNNNDEFLVFGSEPNVQQINLFQIYDRWGNVLFEASDFQPNDPTISWDGTYQNRPMKPGAYTFMISVLYLDGEVITYSGTITLVR